MPPPKPQNVGVLKLEQLLDLALGGQDRGIINFNLLHYILFIMARELNICDMLVEFLGDEAERIRRLFLASASSEIGNKARIHVASIYDEDDRRSKGSSKKQGSSRDSSKDKKKETKGQTKKKEKVTVTLSKGAEEYYDEVEESDDSEKDDNKKEYKKQKGATKGEKNGKKPKQKEKNAKVEVETPDNENLEEVEKIESEVEKELEEEVEKKEDDEKVEKDNNKSKQKETTKSKGRERVSIKEKTKEKEPDTDTEKETSFARGKERTSSIKGRQSVRPKEKERSGSSRRPSYRIEFSRDDTMQKLEDATFFGVKVDRNDYEALKTETEILRDEMNDLKLLVEGTAGVMKEHQSIIQEGSNILEMFTMLNIIKRVEAVETTVTALTQTAADPLEAEYADSPLGNMSTKAALLYLLEELTRFKEEIAVLSIDDRLIEVSEQLRQLDLVYNNQLASLMSQVQDMSRMGDKEAVPVTQDALEQLLERFRKMENDMKTVLDVAEELDQEKKKKNVLLDVLMEEIEYLKCIKVNREDMEMALAEKADLCMITKKVSYDTFDTTTDDLTRALEEAFKKLNEQENIWQEALNELEGKVGKKMDKTDIRPLKDFINAKLGALHKKIKTLNDFKKDNEAAATKYIKNVACLACDAEVVMKKTKDEALKCHPEALPPIQSIAPYLSYELDHLRRQQKMGDRNMNHFEKAVQHGLGDDKSHICSRYCGGNHTTTTPQQRVSRLGHFLEQWGPEVSAVGGGEFRGVDGIMYKGIEKDKRIHSESTADQTLKALPSLVSKRAV